MRGTHGAMGLRAEENLVLLRTSMVNSRGLDGDDVTDFVGSLPAGAPFAVGFGMNDEAYAEMWDVIQQSPEADRQLAQFGVESLDDLKALLGRKMGIAIAGLDEPTPSVAVKVETDDSARHGELVAPLLTELQSSMPLETSSDGDEVFYASGFTLDEVANGRLGDSENYRRVVDTDGDAMAIVYFDVDNLFRSLEGAVDPEASGILGRIAAAGAVSSVDGDRSVVDVRIAFN